MNAPQTTLDPSQFLAASDFASSFEAKEILSASSIWRGNSILKLSIPENYPFRFVGLYTEYVRSSYAAEHNFIVHAELEFKWRGQSKLRIPCSYGQNGIAEAYVLSNTAVHLHPNSGAEYGQRAWTLVLQNGYRDVMAVVRPQSYVLRADEIHFNILSWKATTITIDGFRAWLGCLSLTHPV